MTSDAMLIDPLPVAWSFDAIGTVWRVDTEEPLSDAVRDAVTDRIARFDRDWSRFREDSLVRRILREPGRHRLPDDAPPVLDLYRDLYTATAGQVSPLVGRTLESLGYGPDYRLTPDTTRMPVPRWESAIAWDGTYLETASPVLLDVGAAGKGYLVDLIGELLSERGIPRWVVDAGGDLRARGVPMRIALEHPTDPRRAIGVVELHDGAICASASNRRAWGPGLHHVLDAVTGTPTTEVVATWALASTGLVADGAATALFFDLDPAFCRVRGVETVRLFANGRVERSSGFPGELFG